MSTQSMSIEESNDFMAIEVRLVELVKAAVADMSPAVHVLTTSDIQDVAEKAQNTPAVHLIYGGHKVVEDQRTALRLEHTWYAVAAVRNVAAARSGQAARRDAGRLVARVMGALMGASVQGATRTLELVTPPKPRYVAGFQYIPSAVVVETVFRKP